MKVDDDFPTPPGQTKVDPEAPAAAGPAAKPPGDNVVPIGSAPRTRGKRVSPAERLTAKLDEAGTIVDEFQADAISLLTVPAPVSAGTWTLYAEDNRRAILRLAATRPGMLKFILGGGDAMAFLALGTFVAAMVYSVGVELGRAAGDSVISERLRVAEAFEAVMREREREPEPGSDDEWYRRGGPPERGAALPGILGDGQASPS